MSPSGFGAEAGPAGSDASRPAGAPGNAEPGEAEAGLPAERLLLFTDAVTAISLTLLILPLVDLVPEVAGAHEHAGDVITGHVDKIWSFLLSFAVVARFWLSHHRVFSAVGSLDRALVVGNMGWLLAIVVLPLPTEIVGTFGTERFAAALYYANLLAAMVCQWAMLRVLRTHPEHLTGERSTARRRIADAYVDACGNLVTLILAFALALAVPALQYYSLLLLALVPWAESRLRRRSGR
jgi:uncharacterized membrane protein